MGRAARCATLHVHPPGTGIMHTINLERACDRRQRREAGRRRWAVPDTLIGTDSHTPMINGIGVLGWGVGGLEAESVMFGMPVTLRVPEVVGVRSTGACRRACWPPTWRSRSRRCCARSASRAVRRVLRARRRDACRRASAQRSPTWRRNSAPRPAISRSTTQMIDYLRATGRDDEQLVLVEGYARRSGLWFDPEAAPRYTESVELDLAVVQPSLAGPRRPQDRIAPAQCRARHGARRVRGANAARGADRVAIAAITSCTNTSDPRLLVAAGLVARKARQLGLRLPPWVKTSLAPGSPTAKRLLERAGCWTPSRNSALASSPTVARRASATAVRCRGDGAHGDVRRRPVAVLSGNRNFPGRVHPRIEDALPGLAAAGRRLRAGRRFRPRHRSGSDRASADGHAVHLRDLWPDDDEIDAVLAAPPRSRDFAAAYAEAEANSGVGGLPAPRRRAVPWDPASTYLRRPPFVNFGAATRLGHYFAHPLLVLGDDVTTDHISPAGLIPANSEAGGGWSNVARIPAT